jgi:hypothetical protein
MLWFCKKVFRGKMFKAELNKKGKGEYEQYSRY